MLRHHDSIRLSGVDRDLFIAVTGPGAPVPKTVREYNTRLQSAALAWAQGRSANDRFLASVARGLMLDVADPTAVIDNHRLAALGRH